MLRPALSAAAFAVVLLAIPAAGAIAQPMAMPPPSTNPADVPAGHYANDPTHSALILRVRHMGMTLSTFRMDKIDAGFDYDPAHPEASKVTATIDANSFDQGDPAISTRFAKEFLGADKNPTITFVSTSIKRTDATHGVMTGDLTLEGVTKPVTLDVTFDGTRPAGGMGPARAGFSATGVVKRSEFAPLTMPPAIIGDDVLVSLEIEFVKH
ncbi:MAG: YceI family protein [Caulobacteraceae bacterium]